MALGVKSSPAKGDAGDVGSSHGLGRSPGREHGNPLHYPCLDNPIETGGGWATVPGDAKSQIQLKQLSTHAQHSVQPLTF